MSVCRFCRRDEERVGRTGAVMALDDACTECLGHTPASWQILREAGDVADAEVRPPFVCLIAAMAYASKALDDIAGSLSQHVVHKNQDLVSDALDNLLIAAIEVMEAGGYRAEHNQLLGAIEKYREEAR